MSWYISKILKSFKQFVYLNLIKHSHSFLKQYSIYVFKSTNREYAQGAVIPSINYFGFSHFFVR